MLYRTRYVCLSVLIVFATACDKGVTDSDFDTTRFTEWEINEAKTISLKMTGLLEPPTALWQRFVSELHDIRTEFGEQHSSVNIRYFPGWLPNQVLLQVDEETESQIVNGTYDAWDYLNERFGMTETKVYGSWINLYYSGIFHPARVAELYSELPGVVSSGTNSVSGMNIYFQIGFHDGVYTYLFGHGWGDCPAGCTDGEYWYVRYLPDGPQFVGYWGPNNEIGESTYPVKPEWWEEASQGK
jgi:hypothetical protein